MSPFRERVRPQSLPLISGGQLSHESAAFARLVNPWGRDAFHRSRLNMRRLTERIAGAQSGRRDRVTPSLATIGLTLAAVIPVASGVAGVPVFVVANRFFALLRLCVARTPVGSSGRLRKDKRARRESRGGHKGCKGGFHGGHESYSILGAIVRLRLAWLMPPLCRSWPTGLIVGRPHGTAGDKTRPARRRSITRSIKRI